MNICIIPARGGSKRIPKKNIYSFFDKPMIYWSIKAAQESKCFERIIVSTDDHEISNIAKNFGADVPFIRPKYLSDDLTPTQPVIKHAINWLEDSGLKYKYACCIYATAPLLKANDICKSLKIISNSRDDIMLFSAASFSYPIERALILNKEGFISMLYPENINKRSQDLKETFHDAGQFYWASSKRWVNESNIFKLSKPYILPRNRVQDIDNLEDLKHAEFLFKMNL